MCNLSHRVLSLPPSMRKTLRNELEMCTCGNTDCQRFGVCHLWFVIGKRFTVSTQQRFFFFLKGANLRAQIQLTSTHPRKVGHDGM